MWLLVCTTTVRVLHQLQIKLSKLWFIIIIIYCAISGAGGGQSISQQQRTNSSVHVCWHRSTTVPVAEYHRSLRNLLSGYLLRKFKSSNGWQKLWVIFTNSCLFFFKTFEDDCPLASLPLLGYSVRFDTTFTVKMICHIDIRGIDTAAQRHFKVKFFLPEFSNFPIFKQQNLKPGVYGQTSIHFLKRIGTYLVQVPSDRAARLLIFETFFLPTHNFRLNK